MTELDPRALEAALRAAISDSDASDLAKRMNGGWSAQAALERAMRDAIPDAVTAYLAEASRLNELERENARLREALFETHLDLVAYADIEVARKRLVKRRAALAGSEKP